MIDPLVGERYPSETDKAVQACNDYLRMGAGRSLTLLVQNYNEIKQNQAPTQSKGTLITWSANFGWVERASLYDGEMERLRTEAAQRAMMEGLALDYERVGKLKRLADFLEGQLYEQGEGGVYHNVWLPDVKQIGSGEFAERVDIERFNAPLISEYRSVLDDLAKETGGRKKTVQIGGEKDNPLQVNVAVESMDDFVKRVQDAQRLANERPDHSTNQ